MSKRIKLVRVALLSISLIAVLSGCSRSVELNERAIVEAVGIDKIGDAYSATLKIMSVNGEKKGGENSQKATGDILTSQGKTLFEAFQNAELSAGKNLFFGHGKIVVLGDKAAKDGVMPIMDFLNSNRELNPNIDIVKSKGKAKSIVTEDFEADKIQKKLQNAERGGILERGCLYRVLRDINDENSCACMPFVDMRDKKIELFGEAVFNGDKYVGSFDRDEAKGLAVLKRRARSLSVGFDEFKAENIGVKIKPKNNGGEFVFDIDIKFSCTEKAENSPMRRKPDSEALKNTAENEMKRLAVNALEKCVKLKCDAVGFNGYCKLYEHKLYSANKDDWANALKNARFNVNVVSCNQR